MSQFEPTSPRYHEEAARIIKIAPSSGDIVPIAGDGTPVVWGTNGRHPCALYSCSGLMRDILCKR